MAQAIAARRRKLGVHVSLDIETLERLDAEASRVGVSRSELLRRMIEEGDEQLEAEKYVREQAEADLQEEMIPWEQARAELGL